MLDEGLGFGLAIAAVIALVQLVRWLIGAVRPPKALSPTVAVSRNHGFREHVVRSNFYKSADYSRNARPISDDGC